jgi:hypothetical protein
MTERPRGCCVPVGTKASVWHPADGASRCHEATAFFRASSTDLREAWVLGDLDGLRVQLAKAMPDRSTL